MWLRLVANGMVCGIVKDLKLFDKIMGGNEIIATNLYGNPLILQSFTAWVVREI